MSKRLKIIISTLIAVSSLSAIIVFANELATIIYLPMAYDNYDSRPTPTPIPSIGITGFHPSSDPQEDYVQLKNLTSATIDMTGWRLKPENKAWSYNIPADFKLSAKQTVNIRSGEGTNSATNLYIGLIYSLWTVKDNCAYLRDSDGKLEDKKCVDQLLPTPTSTAQPSVHISGFTPSNNPPNDYVTLTNSTTQSADLTGWWMKAETGLTRYDFPTDFTLDSGASVNIRSGIGTNTDSNLYIGLSTSLWTKANNCAYLRDKNGTLVDLECVSD
jgi:hypothetical protein